MNDDVNPWMIEAANEIGVETRCSDCFCDPHETAAIIARHAPKVDVEAIATRVAIECSIGVTIQIADTTNPLTTCGLWLDAFATALLGGHHKGTACRKNSTNLTTRR